MPSPRPSGLGIWKILQLPQCLHNGVFCFVIFVGYVFEPIVCLLLWVSIVCVTVSPSPQSKDEENEKLHKLRRYARDFRRQHTTDAEQFDWDSDDGDYGLAIGRLVVT
jgi:hypothetical protein